MSRLNDTGQEDVRLGRTRIGIYTAAREPASCQGA